MVPATDPEISLSPYRFDYRPVHSIASTSTIHLGTWEEPCLPITWLTGLSKLVLAVDTELSPNQATGSLSHSSVAVLPA